MLSSERGAIGPDQGSSTIRRPVGRSQCWTNMSGPDRVGAGVGRHPEVPNRTG